MFNSPLLDVTIGLVLIFLLYSLLVTSIQEVIASIFAFRARMLKNAIITGMLSNTPDDSKFNSLVKGFCNYFCNIYIKFIEFFKGKDVSISNKTIGQSLYNHPIIKNYGSSRFFAIPSYITKSNFSKIMIELLKKEASAKVSASNQNSAEIVKIGDVLNHFKSDENQKDCFLDKEPAQILYSFWKESNYNMDVFQQKLESWFDDMMNRVSGWYKRRTQFRLFFIGLVIAVSFNVNTIKIANRLTVDKDSRDKMVQLAIVTADKYKDDPRIKKIITKDDKVIIDTTEKDSALRKHVFNEYKNQLDSVKKLLNGDIAKANQIIAIGWGIDTLYKPYTYEKKIKSRTLKDTLFHTYQYLVNYSKNRKPESKTTKANDTAHFISYIQKWITTDLTLAQNKDSLFKTIRQFTNQPKPLPAYLADSVKMAQFLQKMVKDSICKLSVKVTRVAELQDGNNKIKIQLSGYRHYTTFESVRYVLKNMWKGSAFLGFLITAFAISLGAPFWFDLLNKLIKIRASGKKEEATTASTEQTAPPLAATPPPAPTPTTININTQTKPGEEAAG